jgi:hypothetical protein
MEGVHRTEHVDLKAEGGKLGSVCGSVCFLARS